MYIYIYIRAYTYICIYVYIYIHIYIYIYITPGGPPGQRPGRGAAPDLIHMHAYKHTMCHSDVGITSFMCYYMQT